MCIISKVIVLIFSVGTVLATSDSPVSVNNRSKRGLAYPINSCSGVLFAIAVPLGLPNRNVFMSYNFEANYNMPTSATDIVPGPLDRLDLVDGRKLHLTGDEKTKSKHKRSIITREHFYHFIIRKFNSINLNGKACLLKLICETSNHSLRDHNGLLGDILHVLLSPSTSKYEPIHQEYYNAEKRGLHGDCRIYDRHCPIDLLEIITNFS